MRLGHEQGRAALYDANGQRLRNLAEETQVRQAAETRVQELEAELRRLRGQS